MHDKFAALSIGVQQIVTVANITSIYAQEQTTALLFVNHLASWNVQ